MRGREEPGLVGGRRQVDSLLQHLPEIAGVPSRIGPPSIGSGPDRPAAEEKREQAPHLVHRDRDTRLPAFPDQPLPQDGAGSLQLRVNACPAQGQQSGQARRHRHRMPGQGAGLVDRPKRRDPLHQLAPAAVRPHREPAADHLSQHGQVRLNPVSPLCPAVPDPEPGDHLVEDQQDLLRLSQAAQIL